MIGGGARALLLGILISLIAATAIAKGPAFIDQAGIARTASGRIYRDPGAVHQFKLQTGFPHGRPRYVIDHVVPLACGGADQPSNMQWQTKAEAAAKDKLERQGCRRH